jgi:hypothetical protein
MRRVGGFYFIIFIWCIKIGNVFALHYFPTENWLIIYGFTCRSRIFHLYGDVTIAGERLPNFGLCSALRAFEQGGIFLIVPHLLWHGTSVFPVSSEGPPHLVAFYDTRGEVEDLFWNCSVLLVPKTNALVQYNTRVRVVAYIYFTGPHLS